MAITFNKGYIVIGTFALALLVLFVMAYGPSVGRFSLDNLNVRSGSVGVRSHGDYNLHDVTQELIKQRNAAIKLLNQKQQQLGQIACEKLGSYREATSETGGWCKNSSKEDSEHHRTDKPLANALAEFFKGKNVGSFGDGPGIYKRLILESGKVRGYDSYDGAPYVNETTKGRVNFLDLTLSQFGLPLYDWVMSLEVAEHIPQKFESVYIDNIVRHAREGVILSWATPGQGGYSHVNNRPFKYVVEMFEGLGFSYDEKASLELRNVSTLPWLQKNMSVFRRREYTKIDKESAYFA